MKISIQLLIIFLVLIGLTLSQDTIPKSFNENLDIQIDEKGIHDEQIQQVKEQQAEERKQMQKWVAQQFQQEVQQYMIGQFFTFIVNGGESTTFKWDPKKKRLLSLSIQLAHIDENGDFQIPQNPQQSEYLQVLSVQSQNSKGHFISEGKVYVKKTLKINFNSDFKIIKFFNNHDDPILAEVQLEGEQLPLQTGVDDDQLAPPMNKIKTVLDQIQQTEIKRQARFKAQWGFKDKQQRHQEQMLALTGVELFVILVTAVVQMYCIKNLLDNRIIV